MTLYRKVKKQKCDHDDNNTTKTENTQKKSVTFNEPVYIPPPTTMKLDDKLIPQKKTYSQNDLRMLHMLFPGRRWQ